MERPRDLAVRTQRFSIQVIRVYCALPKNTLGQTLGRQLLRSGTSVGARFREATRARSKAEFISKLNASLQELEERKYWPGLVVESRLASMSAIDPVYEESKELTSLFVTSLRTAKR